jgi:hypothetical protein
VRFRSSSAKSTISAKPSRKSPFTLSWSHYVELLSIKDPDERSFYEIEASNSGWSLPELRRQKASALYHRLALSRDKAGVKRLAEKGQIITKPEDALKEPYVLEFLGLDEKAGYSESDLENVDAGDGRRGSPCVAGRGGGSRGNEPHGKEVRV